MTDSAFFGGVRNRSMGDLVSGSAAVAAGPEGSFAGLGLLLVSERRWSACQHCRDTSDVLYIRFSVLRSRSTSISA